MDTVQEHKNQRTEDILNTAEDQRQRALASIARNKAQRTSDQQEANNRNGRSAESDIRRLSAWIADAKEVITRHTVSLTAAQTRLSDAVSRGYTAAVPAVPKVTPVVSREVTELKPAVNPEGSAGTVQRAQTNKTATDVSQGTKTCPTCGETIRASVSAWHRSKVTGENCYVDVANAIASGILSKEQATNLGLL